MQGFRFSFDFFFFFKSAPQRRIDKLIFAFKLKIYICANDDDDRGSPSRPFGLDSWALQSPCGHSGVIHIKYRIFLISAPFPYPSWLQLDVTSFA